MWAEYGIDLDGAIRVIISSIVFFVGMLALVRIFGPRTMTNLSSFDLAAIIALGAVIGRAILGSTPTLAAGAIGLATLFALQALTGQFRRTRRGARAVNSPAMLLMAGSELMEDNLRRAHVEPDEVYARLRLAGVRNVSEVACVVLESTGQISVLRRGEPISAVLLDGVIGAERLGPDYRS